MKANAIVFKSIADGQWKLAVTTEGASRHVELNRIAGHNIVNKKDAVAAARKFCEPYKIRRIKTI